LRSDTKVSNHLSSNSCDVKKLTEFTKINSTYVSILCENYYLSYVHVNTPSQDYKYTELELSFAKHNDILQLDQRDDINKLIH